jgi:hypothetical protein
MFDLVEGELSAALSSVMFAKRMRRESDLDLTIKLADSNGDVVGVVEYVDGGYRFLGMDR